MGMVPHDGPETHLVESADHVCDSGVGKYDVFISPVAKCYWELISAENSACGQAPLEKWSLKLSINAFVESKNLYDIMLKHEQQGTQDDPEYQKALAAFFKTFIYRGAAENLEYVSPNTQVVETMWGPHELSVTGNLKDYHSIRINDQWRIIFKWHNGHSFDVEIIDYH